MNTNSRTASRGGTKSKDKTNKSESKKDGGKSGEGGRGQPTDRTVRNSTNEESAIKEKVAEIVKILPSATEDDIVTALHDCDNDMGKAVDMLLMEGSDEARGTWETSGKKKRNRQASSSKGGESGGARGDGDGVEEGESQPLVANMDRERSRGRGGGPGRSRGRRSDGPRPGRGRDNNKENEGGGDDGFRGGFRRGGRGMSNGPGSRGGGRGGRGGSRMGSSRTFQSRDRSAGDRFPSTIDTWNPAGSQETGDKALKMDTWSNNFAATENWDNEDSTANKPEAGARMMKGNNNNYSNIPPAAENWDIEDNTTVKKPEPVRPPRKDTYNEFPPTEDWDNEEYQGSLADSKVFTPSALEANQAASEQILETAGAQEMLSMSATTGQEYHQSSAMPSSPLAVGVGQLTTAQAQYLNQLTQQSAENLKVRGAVPVAASTNAYQTESLKTAVGIGGTAAYSQPTSYGQTDSYGQTNYTQSTYGQTANTGYGTTSGSFQTPSGFTGTGSASYVGTTQNYQTAANSSFGGYPATAATNYSTQSYASTNAVYDSTCAQSEVSAVQNAQPPRAKPQRARVPPPSKIPSSAVEMPDDSISVSSLDVQFGGLEFGSDATSFEPAATEANKFQQTTATSTAVSTVDATPSAAAASVQPTAAPSLDGATSQPSTLDSYSGAQNTTAAKASQQASLVSGLSGKGLSSTDGLSIQTSTDHKSNSYNSQSQRVASSASSGLSDLSSTSAVKTEVASSLSYVAPAAVSYGGYQSQKTNNSVYQAANYASSTAYTVPQTTYSTATYNTQQAVNSSYPNSSYSSQPPNSTPVNYAITGAYPSVNSYQNASQSYQSGAGSVYGSALSAAGYSANATGYQNSYSGTSSTAGKLNSSLVTGKEVQEYPAVAATTAGSIASTTNATPSLGLTTTPQTITTSSAKVTTGQIKNSVVPSMHPQLMSTPQYIVNQSGVPAAFYQAPMYAGFDDVLMQQRIHHMPGYYDMGGYSAPTSMAGVAGRESLGSVAYTMAADARYSTRGDNNASPVPSTLSQQTASAAHQPILHNPSFPPGYTYVYGAVPGGFQHYGTPIYPVPSAGNAHGTTSNQYGKPASYASTYGSGYESVNQTADYSKSGYVPTGGSVAKSATTVSSATTASDLYGKQHTALGKVNSYDKQGFHSGTPPPFNLAGGQSGAMAPSGAYGPQLFIPAAMAPHQQHHGTALITSHLQDSGSSGQRSQSAAQVSKVGSKQNPYNTYWPTN